MQVHEPEQVKPSRSGVAVRLVFPVGRPRKYHSNLERRAAARAARARWIALHPQQWKAIQARGYRKRKARRLARERPGVEVKLVC